MESLQNVAKNKPTELRSARNAKTEASQNCHEPDTILCTLCETMHYYSGNTPCICIMGTPSLVMHVHSQELDEEGEHLAETFKYQRMTRTNCLVAGPDNLNRCPHLCA